MLEFETAQPLREDWKITNQENFGDVNTDTESLQKEYKQLQQKLDQQQETSHKEFQSASIAALESW